MTGMAILVLVISLGLVWWTPFISRWETREKRKPFLTEGRLPVQTPFYVERFQAELERWGWSVSKRVITLAWTGLALVGALLPQVFGDPIWMSFGLAALCACLPFPVVRVLKTRYVWRVEQGLRETALPLGLSVLEATEDVGLAVEDILRHGKDPVIGREFEAIRARIAALGVPPEDALVEHAMQSGVPAFQWLAQYTRTLKRYGANPSTIWRDVLTDLQDQAQFRSMMRAKTAFYRYGAYVFGAGGLFGLMAFYHAYAQSLIGFVPWALLAWAVLVGVGIYRMARVGG
ncbi:type II secretion system F family protein [Alicyclobacillus sendaiensis]|uniref:type II secretion system F family protein n=1 Tax=Alicyclobacillus sendaiensis TaxID=192387 RepID=UPI00272B7EB2|nr:hypothetical protein [Alicyclobacillus sendaiensis]